MTTECTEAKTTSISVELKDAGFYFSVDDRSFVPSDLLTAYLIQEDGQKTDVTDQITFAYCSPKAMYDAEEAAYVAAELKAYYHGDNGTVELDDAPMVYIGVKGDTNLDTTVDADDAYQVLLYYASYSVKKTPTFTDGSDENLEKLVFFLSDVDTESIQEQNPEKITPDDAYYQLLYYAAYCVRCGADWAEIIPSLRELEGSVWAL